MFADGSIPPDDVVKEFIDLCDSRFGPDSKNPKATISVGLCFLCHSDSLQGWSGSCTHVGDDCSDRAWDEQPGRYSNGEEVQTGGVQPEAVACVDALCSLDEEAAKELLCDSLDR